MKRHLLAVTLLAWASPLIAHDFWIMPSSFRPGTDERVRIHLLVGENFRGDEVARNDRQIEDFSITTASGKSPVPGRSGSRPAGVAVIADDRSAVVGYRSLPTRHSDMSAEAFEAYLVEEGLEAIVARRKAQGGSGTPGREFFSRSAKALLGSNGLRGDYSARLGYRFELITLTDPHDPRAETITVQALFEGKPLEGVRISAIRQGSDRHLSARTSADGTVRLNVDRPGTWLIKSVHMVPAAADSDADWESIWATVTFQR